MTLAMTLMVRDEADIIVPMIEYHLSAGVDVILVTDNGSIDGTRELLAAYEADPRITVMDAPTHDKNQSGVVTAMARRAATEFGATWVINADADEFFVPRNRRLTLRDVFGSMPTEIVSATIPVVDMTGTPARKGSGISRLTRRDERREDSLYLSAGLHAHATHDAIHIASPDVVVAQGNHYVSLASEGAIPEELRLESLHFPWRSYSQFSRKVRNAGRAYTSNPVLSPSPRHHGMRDYRFDRAGVLEEIYLYRHPQSVDEAAHELPVDSWLVERLRQLVDAPTTLLPDALAAALDDEHDEPYTDSELSASTRIARAALLLEEERASADSSAREAVNARQVAEAAAAECLGRLSSLEQRNAELADQLERIRRTPLYRSARLFLRASRALGRPLRDAGRGV